MFMQSVSVPISLPTPPKRPFSGRSASITFPPVPLPTMGLVDIRQQSIYLRSLMQRSIQSKVKTLPMLS